jgi:hypothetical protein
LGRISQGLAAFLVWLWFRDHIFYHSDADTADLVPAFTRAYLKIVDGVNRREIKDLAASAGDHAPR